METTIDKISVKIDKISYVKDKKLIPLYNPNCNLINPDDLLEFVKIAPILDIENKVIGAVLGDSKSKSSTYIKDNFIYGDIFIYGDYQTYKNYEYYDAELTGKLQSNNDFLIKSVQAIIFKEGK